MSKGPFERERDQVPGDGRFYYVHYSGKRMPVALMIITNVELHDVCAGDGVLIVETQAGGVVYPRVSLRGMQDPPGWSPFDDDIKF